MREEPMETIEYKGYQIKIYSDNDPINPRENDNLGTMICKHRDYNLGDEEISKTMDVDEIKEYVKRKDVISLPLYLLDHSGLWMRTGKFACDSGGWDTSMVGFITVTIEKAKKEMARPKKLKKGQKNPDLTPIKHFTKKDRERVVRMLENEVETYSDYLEGNVVGYVIEKDGEDIGIDSSCWGFFPEHDLPEYGHSVGRGIFEREFGYMIDECKSIIDYHVKEDERVEKEERQEAKRIANIQENVTSA